MSNLQTPASLRKLAFQCTLRHNLKTHGFVSRQDRFQLLAEVLCMDPTYEYLKLYYAETKQLGSILKFMFAKKYFNMTDCADANAITQFYSLLRIDITNLNQEQTLQFVAFYLYLLGLNATFMPERFAILWQRDKENLCKWCSSDSVYVASANVYYTTVCCGILKLSYYDNYELDGFTTDIVTNINSYCRRCFRAMYSVQDVQEPAFPHNMYFCSLCEC
jgi:hypothetical protein